MGWCQETRRGYGADVGPIQQAEVVLDYKLNSHLRYPLGGEKGYVGITE